MAVTPEQVDDLLPQTQCGLCGYGGCMPYAEAMVFEGAAINLCPPGGVKTLEALGALLDQDASPYINDIVQKAKPPAVALIREAECIGCTKCISACPVDAIIGSGKLMHTVMPDLCTGCELCIPPCPVDCIDLIFIDKSKISAEEKQIAHSLRKRFQARQKRLQREANLRSAKLKNESLNKRKAYVEEAIKRAQEKKKLSSY